MTVHLGRAAGRSCGAFRAGGPRRVGGWQKQTREENVGMGFKESEQTWGSSAKFRYRQGMNLGPICHRPRVLMRGRIPDREVAQ